MLTRRHFLAAGGSTLAVAPSIVRAQSRWRASPFGLGIASGEPAADGFVLWTRLAPEPLAAHAGMTPEAVPVSWEVATDDGFASVVASGVDIARPELAHAVHVEVAGLAPARPYFYRFTAAGERSGVGRAQTLPQSKAEQSRLRFGMAGCQDFEAGYYTAYRYLAQERLDFVFHYGDYIYEYGPGEGRVRGNLGSALVSLDDYRRRYAQYKADPDLQAAHAAHPFFVTFDDHEVANNWAGDHAEDSAPRELFRLRRAWAFQAWYENMPVRRRQRPSGSGLRLFRGARFGTLAQLDFLDTRQFRTDQPCGDGYKPQCSDALAATNHIISAQEESWLAHNLRRDEVRWNAVAQQVMMMAIDRREASIHAPGKIVNLDSWAGYEAQRRRVLARMRGLNNVIVLTGDEHSNYAGHLNDRDTAVAIEFVGTSISSDGDGQDLPSWGSQFLSANPQLSFINNQRGYLTFDVTPEEWRTNFRVLDKVSTRDGTLSTRATYSVAHGEPKLRAA